MGLKPAVVTSIGADDEEPWHQWGIPFRAAPATETTAFRNIYSEDKRVQFVEAVAGPITEQDVPEAWRRAPMVLLGPLVGEVSYGLARHFPGSTVVASMQGWLRSWDTGGRVTARSWEGAEVLPHVDAAVVSRADAAEGGLIERWAELAPVLIVTMGLRGARVHFEGRWHDVAAFKASVRDPTGAGDVLSAAYLVMYQRSGDVLEAARFASCAAALSVEGAGTSGIPTMAEVETRMAL